MENLEQQLSLLGRKTQYKESYAPEVLEAFDNKHTENDYWVRFNCPRVHIPLPYYRTARLCRDTHQLHTRQKDGREQEP